MEIPTLDGVDVKGKTVLVRVDINSPIDPNTSEILDDTRIRECAPTIKELAFKGAKVVVLAHQGRPGDKDFTTLEKHARKLSAALGLDVKYTPFSLLGPLAVGTISLMRPGEVFLLDNVRFLAEEGRSGPPEELAKTHLVQRLAYLARIYVNDAFGAAHRSSPSLVGFNAVLSSYAGRLMEKEIKGLSRAISPEHPCVYMLGGAKADDAIKIVENILSKGTADTVLTGGVVGNIFLMASGVDIGGPNTKLIVDEGYEKMVERVKKMLSAYGSKIKIPVDVVVDAQGEPKVLSVGQLPTELQICDIGPKTVEEYSKALAGAKTIVAKGPMGVFERKGFERGTLELLRAMASSQAFTVLGGGHVVAAANAAGVSGQIKHISTGGGAAVSFLSGEPMPAIEALICAKQVTKPEGGKA